MSSGGDTSNGNPTEKDKNDALYEDREPKKIIRIITVTAYMFSVSFVGIVLSAYYIFLWHPPNPRMMHAQAMSAHSEAQIDFLLGGAPSNTSGLSRMARLPEADRAIDVFGTQPGTEKTKTRREILKNVNAVLRANFEKIKSSEAPLLLQDVTLIINNITSLQNDKETSEFNDETSATISSILEISKTSTEKSSINGTTMTASTLSKASSPTRKSKNPGKKQHQTPFALKHLEMPIKQNESRRRSTRPSITSTMAATSAPTTKTTTTTAIGRSPPTTLDTRGTMISYISPATMQLPRKMSAHNVMASISRTLGTRHGDEKPANEVKFAGEESKDKLYEPKHKQKLVRVLTVVAYIISVSLAAIVLSLYYMYIWDPSDHLHYIAKQRINVSITSSNAAKLPCPDVTPARASERESSTANGFDEAPLDKIKLLSGATTKFSEESDIANSQNTVKNLLRTLSPLRSRDGDDSSLTDFPEILPISADQFQAIPQANIDNYSDSTIESEDELLDD